MRYFSLFSGVGGFELGIEKAYEDKKVEGAGTHDQAQPRGQEAIDGSGVDSELPLESGGHGTPNLVSPTCVGLSEIDKHASAVLRYRFPNVKNYGDITRINWAEVPDFDLLVGGSPCQSFSIAGKRAGLEGSSGLFVEYVRCLKEKKPEHFIWENVKGVFSSGKGADFAYVLDAFSEAGYSLWWQVLNAKHFGVPQNRERVFVVGTRIGSPREVFFERRFDQDGTQGAGQVPRREAVGATLSGRSAGGGNARGNYVVSQTNRLNDTQGASPALQASVGGRHQPMVVDRGTARATGDTATAVDANYHKGPDNHGQRTMMLDGARIRRLTPRECERLMSWPDDWTKWGDYGDGIAKEIKDTNRYKQCGNGVVSFVVSEVVREMLL